MMMLFKPQVMDEESPRSIYAKKNNIGRKQNGFFTRKSKCIFYLEFSSVFVVTGLSGFHVYTLNMTQVSI